MERLSPTPYSPWLRVKISRSAPASGRAQQASPNINEKKLFYEALLKKQVKEVFISAFPFVLSTSARRVGCKTDCRL